MIRLAFYLALNLAAWSGIVAATHAITETNKTSLYREIP